MSAIATVLVEQGHTVSGSDAAESRTLDRLRDLGVTVAVGHAPANLPAELDAVMVSTAIAADNAEVVLAHERGVPVLSRAAGLTALTVLRRTAAVAGSHGKTTTASMLTSILREAALDPSFVIGGDLTALDTNAAWGSNDLFVVEADESDGTFLALDVDATIITNIEPDHLEHWGGFDAVIRGFDTYAAGISGAVVICADEPNAARIIAGRRADGRPTIAYGFATDADVSIVEYEPSGRSSTFTLHTPNGAIGPITLPSPGRHNASNAAGAAALALELGAPADAIVRALDAFGGVARRFQYRGEADGVTFIDDYAHLPSEVAAAIAAAQDGDWSRVVVVFQPHRYSRTEALWSEFDDAFVGADVLYLTDVYSAGEAPRPGVDGHLIVEAVLDAHPATAVTYLPGRAELLSVLRTRVRPGDLVLTLGAGDLTTLPDEWPVSC
jgi:UDP-N-acetylmuramate--alanine ligase